jgi:hypothetical protein
MLLTQVQRTNLVAPQLSLPDREGKDRFIIFFVAALLVGNRHHLILAWEVNAL